jgi:phosphohistidine swiveling domain-containing protein
MRSRNPDFHGTRIAADSHGTRISADLAMVVPLAYAGDVRDVGGKACNLARLIRLGHPVPDGFVVTDAALSCFLDEHDLSPMVQIACGALDVRQPFAIQSAAETIAALVRNCPLPSALSADLDLAVVPFLSDTLIVRSSAVGEDSGTASFAGQLDSIAGVSGAGLVRRALLDVWASRWSARALTYQLARGASLDGMGVIVQRQVESVLSGVLFTVAPDDEGEMLIEYCAGSGEALVSGRVNPGRVAIDRGSLRASTRAVLETSDFPAGLPLDLLSALARRALDIERAFGCPQDIEWTMDVEGGLWIVQSRPITVVGPRRSRTNPDRHTVSGTAECAPSRLSSQANSASARRVFWSNANVNENFPQPITPLLYSIARTGYYHYFRNLALAFGLSRRRVAAMEQPLGHIIGVHGARMYYNLTSIHGVLRSAPFGDLLAAWFNQFVGSEDTDTPAFVEPDAAPNRVVGPFATDDTGRPADHRAMRGWSPSRAHQKEARGHTRRDSFSWVRLGDAWLGPRVSGTAHGLGSVLSVFSVGGFDSNGPIAPGRHRWRVAQAGELAVIAVKTTWQYLFVSRRVARFERTVTAFADRTHPRLLETRSRRDLLDDFRAFLDIRNHRWLDASLADTASMVCYGALQRWLSRAFPTADQATLHNSLLKALPGLPSGTPALKIWDLSRLVRADQRLLDLLAAVPADEALATIRRDPAFASFARELDQYLNDWGFRCSGELMLTVKSFQEDPAPLVDIIKAYVRSDGQSPADQLRLQKAERLRDTERVAAELRKRRLFRYLPFVHQWHVVSILLHRTQASIILRERARLKQALLYSRLRRIALSLGERLVADRRLDRADDIFFLTAGEIDEVVAGCAMFPDHQRHLVDVRRQAHAHVGATAPPDSMTLDEGEYSDGLTAGGTSGDDGATTGGALSGLGVCGGTTTARAAVLTDVTEAHLLQPGDVLITRQTDPGWAAVFPLISGLVMERGGMLSHGAIIAREFGIPSVVGIGDATRLIPHGALVHVDGDRGLVRVTGGAAS